MDKIATDLGEGAHLGALRELLAIKLRILAISKDELTEADVEPFKINLLDTNPSFERPLRYNPTLTSFIDSEV